MPGPLVEVRIVLISQKYQSAREDQDSREEVDRPRGHRYEELPVSALSEHVGGEELEPAYHGRAYEGHAQYERDPAPREGVMRKAERAREQRDEYRRRDRYPESLRHLQVPHPEIGPEERKHERKYAQGKDGYE